MASVVKWTNLLINENIDINQEVKETKKKDTTAVSICGVFMGGPPCDISQE